MGILDDDVQEEVIDKALLMAEDEITLKEIKTITVLAMFANSQNEWRREFDCLLEDDWQRLLN
jgi:Smg protein